MWYRFLRDEQGATAIEYALLATLAAIAAIGAMTAFGEALSTKFSHIASAVSSTN